MAAKNALSAAKEIVMSGQRHHLYEDERKHFDELFHMDREDLCKLIDDSLRIDPYYASVLGKTRVRAVQNALICVIYPICRQSIDSGADVELAFALSDYFIGNLENYTTEQELLLYYKEILLKYYDLVKSETSPHYSKPIVRALRFIGRNLYGSCTVEDVACHVELERPYFSSLFTKQVGVSPSRYILQKKLEEGWRLMLHQGTSVTDVSELLGFSDVSHFCKRFKQLYGVSPSKASKMANPPIVM